MENLIEMRSTSDTILRFIRVSRIILFGCAIGIQTYLGIQFGIMYILGTIAAPCFIIVLDLLMFNRNKDQFKEFYLAAVIVCLIALYVTAASMLPLVFFPYVSSFVAAVIYLMGFGTMIISFIELILLIYLTRPQEDYSEKVWEDDQEVWDRKDDTIDIQ